MLKTHQPDIKNYPLQDRDPLLRTLGQKIAQTHCKDIGSVPTIRTICSTVCLLLVLLYFPFLKFSLDMADENSTDAVEDKMKRQNKRTEIKEKLHKEGEMNECFSSVNSRRGKATQDTPKR